MKNNKLFVQIRNKKIGLLISDARLSKNISISDLSSQTGIPEEKFTEFETGTSSPSLPELEIIAYSLNVPLEHFWGKQIFQSDEDQEKAEIFRKLMNLRNKIIGTNIIAKREENGLSIETLADQTEIDINLLTSYESGEIEIPVPVLEILAKTLNCQIEVFFDNQGKIGAWRKEKAEIKSLQDLPQNFREFITKPINAPYLDLAIKLSEMDVKKLRLVAEGLLEITL
ncbi:MAG TPA: helix-turn-helix transcriptional regulator [Anaerolineaceae bacterium]|nr:helix-turn-helix transcriptional regulator [Anaerolineaceae bacterium]